MPMWSHRTIQKATTHRTESTVGGGGLHRLKLLLRWVKTEWKEIDRSENLKNNTHIEEGFHILCLMVLFTVPHCGSVCSCELWAMRAHTHTRCASQTRVNTALGQKTKIKAWLMYEDLFSQTKQKVPNSSWEPASVHVCVRTSMWSGPPCVLRCLQMECTAHSKLTF